mgnify:CR=1 FL=1
MYLVICIEKKFGKCYGKGGVILKRYAVKNDYIAPNKVISILNYDIKTKQFTIDIPEEAALNELPYIISSLKKRGFQKIGPEWSMIWVRSRIVPNTRQNIGQILRANKMRRYDEYELLLKNQGRCCQDEYYLEEIE